MCKSLQRALSDVRTLQDTKGVRMTTFGYTLFCEGYSPSDLIKQAIKAEEAGFDFLVISDHYHPWLTNHEHSAFAWSVLGALTQVTQKIELATMVTCPIMRYHPAIIAQMAATIGVMSGGRFTLGLGAGERLNEHIVGQGWPGVGIRHKMLREAVEIIQGLWKGGYYSYDGKYYKVEDARVFDLPKEPVPIFMAAGGPNAASIAAQCGVGLCNTEPNPDVMKAYKEQGGDAANTWSQIVLSWDENEDKAKQTAFDQFKFSAGGWKVQAELPNPVNFDAATKQVRPDDIAENIPCGPDVQKHVDGIKSFSDLGYDKIAVVYPGTDTDGFMKFWQDKLKPQL